MNMPQNVISGFMCYYEQRTFLYDICELYWGYCANVHEVNYKHMMYDFAWFPYLVHSCTNTILHHLLTQSVGVDGYRISTK